MLLNERDIDPDIITPILGKPYRKPGKLITATGSCTFFLKKFLNSDGSTIPVPDNMKGIIQRYEKGLMVMLNKSNTQKAVLLPYPTIQEVTLEIGKEVINPKYHLTFRMINKANQIIGLPIKWIALLFGILKVEDSFLHIKTNEYSLSVLVHKSNVRSLTKYFNYPEISSHFIIRE